MKEPNPYQAPLERGSETPSPKTTSWVRTAIAGSVWSIVSAFPITALMALFFRFPVPFGEIEGGWSHVVPALFALLFYGVLLGGFVVVGICGGLAGLAAHFLAQTAHSRRRLQRCLSITATFVLLFILATLDWYIGPW